MLKFKLVRTSKASMFALATAGVLTAIVVGRVITMSCTQTSSAPGPSQTQSAVTSTIDPKAIEMANEQLNWAHNESFARLDGHFAPVASLFDAARTQEFAESCLGWTSKWLMLKDGINDAGEHATFIAGEFRSHVLDHDELQRSLEQCTKAYVQEVDSIDGEMLVRLQVDLASQPAGTVPTFDAASINARYADALQRAIVASRSDVLAMVKREAASFIVSEVVSAALVQLGVSSGIIATGAASGWATFGTGLLVGVVVDYAVQQYTDPAGELARDLDTRLQNLQRRDPLRQRRIARADPAPREFAQTRAVAAAMPSRSCWSEPARLNSKYLTAISIGE